MMSLYVSDRNFNETLSDRWRGVGSRGVVAGPDLPEPGRHMIDAATAGKPVTCADTGRGVRADVVACVSRARWSRGSPTSNGVLLDDGFTADGRCGPGLGTGWGVLAGVRLPAGHPRGRGYSASSARSRDRRAAVRGADAR
jgi:hypothetical protein